MKASDKFLPTRILIWSLIIGFTVIGYTAYSQYSTEIHQEVTESLTKALPDLDHAVAKL